MPAYKRLGLLPPKRHIELKQTPGYRNEGIYYEEVVTLVGFSRAYSVLYHKFPPTRVRKVEAAGSMKVEQAELDVLRHAHLKTKQMPRAGDPITGRVPMLFNADVCMWRCRPAEPQKELFRNAECDEVIFVHHGRGTLHTMFGMLPFKEVDYVVVPRCTTYRIEFEAGSNPDLLIIESKPNIEIPPRYLNADGQIRMGAPYYERDFHGPAELSCVDAEGDATVLIKHGDKLTRYVLAHHPFDIVGWDGFVYPYTFNADDFEPITGKIHQPPPVHQTFETSGFVVCTFAPRMLDYHPESVKVPYVHSNMESDEVLYYVRGHFGSRRGVEEASFTLHPHGIPHGPHPGTIVASRSMNKTDELAVMVDTFRPLHLAKPALTMDDPSYPYSWLE